MNYYRSTITNKIITEKVLRGLYDIYGKESGNHVDLVILKEHLEPVESPSLEDCIQHGNDGVAIIRFRELNQEASFEEAKEAIRSLRKELKRTHKKKK